MLCTPVLDEWQISVLVPIFKRKEDVRNCNAFTAVKLLEQVMKIVEMGTEIRIQKLVNVDAMQFFFLYQAEEQQTHCLLRKECKSHVEIRRNSCIYFLDIKMTIEQKLK